MVSGKIFLFLVVFIAIILSLNILSSVFAYNLGIRPTEVKFEGKINERICKNVTLISGDYKGQMIAEDRWAEKSIFVRDFKAHNLTSSLIGIDIVYSKEFNIQNEKDISVCLNSKFSGLFHGLLIFTTKGGNIGVGTWLNIRIADGEGNIVNDDENGKITGFIIGNNDFSSDKDYLIIIYLSSTSLFLLILFFIMLKLHKS